MQQKKAASSTGHDGIDSSIAKQRRYTEHLWAVRRDQCRMVSFRLLLESVGPLSKSVRTKSTQLIWCRALGEVIRPRGA